VCVPTCVWPPLTRCPPFPDRIVSCDSRSRRDGKFLEIVGTYDPIARKGVKEVRLNVDRVKYWLGVGAQPSDTTARLLGQFGLLPRRVHKESRIRQIPRDERREFSTLLERSDAGEGEAKLEEEGSVRGEFLARLIAEGKAPWAMLECLKLN